MRPNTIADTASVEVRQGALLQTLKDEVIGDLIVNEGSVDISADQDGTLPVSSLNMTGGNIHSSAGGKLLVLARRRDRHVQPEPAARHHRIQRLASRFDATRTFTVLDGPGFTELEIRASIVALANVAQITAAPADASVGLIKDGPGTLVFTNAAPANDYQGLTWVKEGRLDSARTVGKGDVRIGDGVGPTGQAEFVPLVNNAIPVARSVTVEADGFFRISGLELAFDGLMLNGGRVELAGARGSVGPHAVARDERWPDRHG